MPCRRLAPLVAAVAVAAALGSASCGSAAPPPPPILNPGVPAGLPGFDFRFEMQPFMLKNGLFVAMVPDRNTNLVQVDLRYKVGAIADPPGKEGLAHVVEHVLFTARPGRAAATDGAPPSPSLGDQLRAAALSHNAFTTWEETHYTATALSERTEDLLAIESARLGITCEDLSEEAIAREIKIVQEELREREVPEGDPWSALISVLYGDDHAYARPPGGTVDSVATITRDDVCAFLEDHYAPSRAILVVSGHIDRDALQPQVERLFAGISREPRAEIVYPEKLEASGTRTARARIERPLMVAAFPRSRWSSNEAIVESVVDDLVKREIRILAGARDWVRAVAVHTVGGYHTRATAVFFWLEDESRFDDALALIDEARERARKIDYTEMSRLRKDVQAAVLRAAEPFGARAVRVADYFQYARHTLLLDRDLEVIRRLRRYQVLLAIDESFDDPAVIQVARWDEAEDAEELAGVSPGAPGRDYDIEIWREPVDPREAARPLAMPERPEPVEMIRETLDNGVEVVLVPVLAYPVVDIRVVFPAGRLYEPDDVPGVAELAAYLLEPDPRIRIPHNVTYEVERVIERGGTFDIDVGAHAVTFQMRGLGPLAKGYLWQLYWVLQSGVYDDQTVENVMKIYEERRVEQPPVSLLARSLYGEAHPYARAKQPGTIRAKDLAQFRDQHYSPAGATVIVTGKFDVEEVRAQVARLFGSLRGEGEPPAEPEIPAAPPRERPAFLAEVDDDADQLEVIIAFAMPSGFEHRAAREVVAELLRVRLSTIRWKLGATYGVAVVAVSRRGPGALVIEADIESARAPQILSLMMDTLDDVRAGNGLVEDFVRARRRVFERYLGSSVHSTAAADQLEHAATFGLPADYKWKLAREVATLEPVDIRALVNHEIPARAAVVELTGPAQLIDEVYEQAGVDHYERTE